MEDNAIIEYPICCSMLVLSFSLGPSDFFNILPVDIMVEGSDVALIELRTRTDIVTLEYDDTVLLVFSPNESDLIQIYEIEGEYIRDNVVVNIVDNDRKSNVL